MTNILVYTGRKIANLKKIIKSKSLLSPWTDPWTDAWIERDSITLSRVIMHAHPW